MNYEPLIRKLYEWESYDYKEKSDAYRSTHDHDCVLTGGNLFADTIVSLWLPLRYTLNHFEYSRWTFWKDFSAKNAIRLKTHRAFIEELERDTERFLPQEELTQNLIELFEIGQRRCNVMILPDRTWNARRGMQPYFDYLPHFLYDLLSGQNPAERQMVVTWIRREKLTMFFRDGVIDRGQILDLAGTGCVCRHAPKQIKLALLLENYTRLLRQREAQMAAEPQEK